MAPIKTFQIRTKYAAWVCDNTKAKMKARDTAQDTASKSRLDEDWLKYKQLRNEVTSLLRNDKLEWQQRKNESCEQISDTGKLWKNILGWLNWSSSSSPSKLLHQGNLETSPALMADLQNRFYVDKVRTIRRSLKGQQAADPLGILRTLLAGNQASFSSKPVCPESVEKIIGQLKNSKASGLDNLDTYILKLCRKPLFHQYATF